jgi:hypothetical protein
VLSASGGILRQREGARMEGITFVACHPLDKIRLSCRQEIGVSQQPVKRVSVQRARHFRTSSTAFSANLRPRDGTDRVPSAKDIFAMASIFHPLLDVDAIAFLLYCVDAAPLTRNTITDC